MQQDDPLRHTIAELTSRIQDEVSRRIDRLTLDVEAAEARGRQAGYDTGAREALTAAAALEHERAARLLAALDTLEAAASLGTTLDALVETAAQQAGRAALFIVRGQMLESWRFAGFSPRPDLDRPLVIALAEDGALSRAWRSATRVRVPAVSAAPDFATLPDGHDGLVLPVLLAGQAVAVLYADDAGSGSAEENSSRKAEDETAGDAAPFWQFPVVLLARHAARCLESKTALGAARFVAGEAGWLGSRDGHAAAADTSGDEARRTEDARQAAHRYARLLVSEIKLYHEDAIAAGRRDRNLLARVGGEIARAQTLYDERVPASIRQATDFFREELVRTLAGGDATLLRPHS